ncbi:hypothetical protein C8R44DRAFT_726893 [Mycena epipterygia]|nr:hypothetical protein C8R44DRAFT_726893 [Mycena epipterygia]
MTYPDIQVRIFDDDRSYPFTVPDLAPYMSQPQPRACRESRGLAEQYSHLFNIRDVMEQLTHHLPGWYRHDPYNSPHVSHRPVDPTLMACGSLSLLDSSYNVEIRTSQFLESASIFKANIVIAMLDVLEPTECLRVICALDQFQQQHKPAQQMIVAAYECAWGQLGRPRTLGALLITCGMAHRTSQEGKLLESIVAGWLTSQARSGVLDTRTRPYVPRFLAPRNLAARIKIDAEDVESIFVENRECIWGIVTEEEAVERELLREECEDVSMRAEDTDRTDMEQRHRRNLRLAEIVERILC